MSFYEKNQFLMVINKKVGKKSPIKKLSIIIPVRNEGVNLKLLLKILISVLEFPHEILVVYDSQEDDSIPVVKKLQKSYSNIKLIHNILGNGVANAIKSGIKESFGDYLLIFAADEIGPVLAIEDMIFLMNKGCDLVSCTRYAYGGKRLGGSLIQAILSKIGNRLFQIIIGTALTDSTTGIKMFRRQIFDQIELESQLGWAVLFELTIKSQILQKKLGEVPIISIDRLYGGKSSFRVYPWLKEYTKWFIYGLLNIRSIKKKQEIMIRIPQNALNE